MKQTMMAVVLLATLVGPGHAQDVDITRIPPGANWPLDAEKQRTCIWLEPIHLVGGQTLEVVADHALAEARLVAYLALTGKGDATISGSPRQPQHDKLACRRQIQFPNPCSHLVAHGRRRPIVNGACEHLLFRRFEIGHNKLPLQREAGCGTITKSLLVSVRGDPRPLSDSRPSVLQH